MMDKHSERDDVSMFFPFSLFSLGPPPLETAGRIKSKKNRTGPLTSTIATSVCVCVCAYVNTVQSAMRSHTLFLSFLLYSFLHSCPFSCGTRTTHSESGTISSTRRWERKEIRNCWNDQCSHFGPPAQQAVPASVSPRVFIWFPANLKLIQSIGKNQEPVLRSGKTIKCKRRMCCWLDQHTHTQHLCAAGSPRE